MQAQSCRAVTPAGEVLGWAHQQVWVREEQAFKPRETRSVCSTACGLVGRADPSAAQRCRPASCTSHRGGGNPRLGRRGARFELDTLATGPVGSAEDARRCRAAYRLRWRIEEYRKCLKTGCRIEAAQLKSADALQALLGFQGVVAARLLPLGKAADEHPDTLAESVFFPEAVDVMGKYLGLSRDPMAVARFRLERAKLGGFIGRKSDGRPGWQELMLMTKCYMLTKYE